MTRVRPAPLVLAMTAFVLALATVVGASPNSPGPTSPGPASPGPARSGDAPEALVAAGRELYLTGCSSCHGVEGKGVRYVEPGHGLGDGTVDPQVAGAASTGQLRGPSLLESGAAAAYYYLATGRMPLANPEDQPIAKAPAYGPDAIDALVAYVASLGNGPALPDVDLSGTDLAVGGVVFRENCQACHSAFGSGGALSYGRSAPNLHSAEPLEVGAAVRAGPGLMPVFGEDLIDDDELDDLAAYVEYLKSPANPGGLQVGRNGPVPEGFVIWLVGVGTLLGVVAWIGGRAPIRVAPEEGEGNRR